MWVPTALLPRFGVGWTAGDARHVAARYQLDEVELPVHFVLDDDALVQSEGGRR